MADADADARSEVDSILPGAGAGAAFSHGAAAAAAAAAAAPVVEKEQEEEEEEEEEDEEEDEEEEEQEENSSRHCILVVLFSISTVPNLSTHMSLARPSLAATASSITRFETASVCRPMLYPGATADDLKRLIRSHLPAQFSRNRLRLVYAGRLLPDGAPLRLSLGDVALGINRGPPKDGSGSGSGEERLMHTNIDAQNAVDLNELKLKRKGKEKRMEKSEDDEAEVQDKSTSVGAVIPASKTSRQIYIHCSIGHIPEKCPDASSLQMQSDLSSTLLPTQRFQQPQGFDRLLAPNFTRDDVTNLRTQFRSLLSYTHTPDRMPSRTVQRALEERWLDGDGASASASASGGLAAAPAAATSAEGGGGGGGYGNRTAFTTADSINNNLPNHATNPNPNPATSITNNNHTTEAILDTNTANYSTDINMSLIDADTPDDVVHDGNIHDDTTTTNADPDAGSDTSLDDILLGTVLGFFWPIGALVWGLREENVWARRRQVSVLTGVLLNLAFGFSKITI